MRNLLLAAALLLLTTSGCATLFTGTSDTITIDSEPSGARVFVDGIEQGVTPATVRVRRSLGTTLVTLKLEGYDDRTFELMKEFNTVSVLNLFSPLSWAIDIATGALMRYNPKGYDLRLEPVTAVNARDLPTNAAGHVLVPPSSRSLAIHDAALGVTLVVDP